MIDERDYEIARRNLNVRQAFLNGIDMEEYAPFVKRIKSHNKDRICGKFLMATNSYFNLGCQATIHVGNFAFERFSPVEFYNSIVHHEGVHTRQLYHNPITLVEVGKQAVGLVFKKSGLVMRSIEKEIEAYENQMNHPSFGECSHEYRKSRQGAFEWLVRHRRKVIL